MSPGPRIHGPARHTGDSNRPVSFAFATAALLDQQHTHRAGAARRAAPPGRRPPPARSRRAGRSRRSAAGAARSTRRTAGRAPAPRRRPSGLPRGSRSGTRRTMRGRSHSWWGRRHRRHETGESRHGAASFSRAGQCPVNRTARARAAACQACPVKRGQTLRRLPTWTLFSRFIASTQSQTTRCRGSASASTPAAPAALWRRSGTRSGS